MRRAGLVVDAALTAVEAAVAPGVTTAELDAIAAEVIRAHGATSNFLGYYGYPATTCISVNDEVVHGIPGPRPLEPGDVVSVDCGAIVDGWHGDAARTFLLDPVAPADRELSEVTRQSLLRGIAALRVGGHIGAVGEAIEEFVAGRFGIATEYSGHGIGSAMHQPPDVYHHRTRSRGPRIRAGLCVAVEPMIMAGDQATRELDDEWTVVTVDGSRAAHWEHTVAIFPEGVSVLTAPDCGAAELAPLGVRVISFD